MGEVVVQFNCPLCEQSLEAEDTSAGLSVRCPRCGGTIRIPNPLVPPGWNGMENDRQSDSTGDSTGDLRRELEAARWELGQSKKVLGDTLQQFRAARDELEKLRVEVELSENSNAVLRMRLKETEELRGKQQVFLQSAELQGAEISRQLELTKTQRSAYLWETKRLEGLLSESNKARSKLAADRRSLEQTVLRAIQANESLQGESKKNKRDSARKAEELASALAGLEFSEKCRDKLEAERERLSDELLASKDATALRRAELRVEELQSCLTELTEENGQLRGSSDEAHQESSLLRTENRDLRLQLAALRETLAGSHLHQENELLRGVLERTNEQIRALNHSSLYARKMAQKEPDDLIQHRTPVTVRWLQNLFARWGLQI